MLCSYRERSIVISFPLHYVNFNAWSCWISFTALYFIAVATVAAFIGQHVVRRIIILLGRASLIIFILAFTIFVSAISLGKSYHLPFLVLLSIFSWAQYKLVWSSVLLEARIFLNLLRICPCLKCFFLFVLNRWCWHFKHDWKDWTPWIHGLWEPLQV